MSSLNLQFHCSPDEIANFIGAATKGEVVHLVLLGGRPFNAVEVESKGLAEALTLAGHAGLPMALYILRDPPELAATSRADFYARNPENIVVDIGTFSQLGLKQSAISTKTGDASLMKLAKKIAKEIKTGTQAGVTAVNVDTGAKVLMKTFRYSDEALNLERGGIDMLPFAGGVKLILGNVVD